MQRLVSLTFCPRSFVLVILCFCISCTSDSDLTKPSESDDPTDQSLLEPVDLTSTRWVVLEASDAQGTVRIPRDPVNYVLIFRDEPIYEHWIICQPFTGFYELDSSLLNITSL